MRAAAPGPDRSRMVGVVDASRAILDGAQDLARRSRRVSWLAWGSFYAAYGGFLVLVLLGLFFPVPGSVTNGSSGLSVPPLWAYLVSFSPAGLLLVAAVRELFAARAASRAVIRGVSPGPARPRGPDERPGWTQQVVESQKLLTNAKVEVDWSILPIAGCLLGLDGAVGLVVETATAGSASLVPFLGVVLGLGFVCPFVYLLYRIGQQWIGGFQQHLDRQVREVSALEAEFLWRFAGSPA